MVNIQKIAELSGTSRGTVSRVLNNGSVKKETRERVEKVIKQLEYEPSQAARTLRMKRSGLVGLVLPTFSGGFFGDAMHEIQGRLIKDDRMLVVIEGLSATGEKEAVKRLIKMNCEGIILDSRYLCDDSLKHLVEKTQTPMVLLDRAIEDLEDISFSFDHQGVAKKMTEELIRKGHKNIACISGRLDRPNSLARANGYLSAMQDNGLNTVMYSGEYTPEFGQETMRNIVKLKDRPTGLLCCSEMTAAGALKICNEFNLSVPDDLEVVTFDTYKLCDLLQATISYEIFPIVTMSISALEKLNNMISKSVGSNL